jgi:hypothetical protein
MRFIVKPYDFGFIKKWNLMCHNSRITRMDVPDSPSRILYDIYK